MNTHCLRLLASRRYFADKPDLAGRVLTAGDKPVAGAHVMIDSAAVRQGTSPLCPSCYADCRKRAETDQDGQFRIASVDPELLFNVLVVAEASGRRSPRRLTPQRDQLTSSSLRSTRQARPQAHLARVVLDPPASRSPAPGSRRRCSRQTPSAGFLPTSSTPWP